MRVGAAAVLARKVSGFICHGGRGCHSCPLPGRVTVLAVHLQLLQQPIACANWQSLQVGPSGPDTRFPFACCLVAAATWHKTQGVRFCQQQPLSGPGRHRTEWVQKAAGGVVGGDAPTGGCWVGGCLACWPCTCVTNPDGPGPFALHLSQHPRWASLAGKTEGFV